MRYIYVLYYISEPPKCNTAATVTQLVDQKLNVGAYSNLGGLQQVFFLKHMVGWLGLPKKSGAAFGSRAEVPQILPQNSEIWVIRTNHPVI